MAQITRIDAQQEDAARETAVLLAGVATTAAAVVGVVAWRAALAAQKKMQ